MVNLKNKKGAVELSLNLIIMLVIGLTVLGLIIAFVTSFLGSAEDTFKGKLSEDDKTKIEQVERETGNFAFLESSVSVIQGSKSPGKLYVKIRNPTENPFDFSDGGLIESSGNEINVVVRAGKNDADITGEVDVIKIYGPPILLNSGESDGYSLEVYADETAAIGTYYAKFTIELGGKFYDQVVNVNVE